jgi:putative transcriptional regulator
MIPEESEKRVSWTLSESKAIVGQHICQECNIFYTRLLNGCDKYHACQERPSMEVIKIRIDELLKEHERTFYWLAKETGVSHTTLWRLKKDRAQGITFNTLERVCTALACQPGDVLTLGPPKKNKKLKVSVAVKEVK